MVAAPAPAPAPVSERVALLSGVPSRTEGGAGTLGLELERVSSSSAVGKRVKSSASEDDDDDEEDDSEDDSGSLFPPQPVPGVHLATVAQKRALWWRSVVITGMFILTW
jgi:hypothetical protein